MSYFSSRDGVPGVLRQLVLTDGMGWDGMVGQLFFWPISQKLLDIFLKNLKFLRLLIFSQNKYLEQILTRRTTNTKNCLVVFKIWAKKKVDRPPIPSHPSVNKKSAGAPGTPLRK